VPECFGKKLCPANSVGCRAFQECVDELVLRKLRMDWSITKIRLDVKDILPTWSNFIIMRRIGTVAEQNCIHFGYMSVRTAIENCNFEATAADPELEKREIRRAFGVYGRKRSSSPNSDVGYVEPENAKFDEDASC